MHKYAKIGLRLAAICGCAALLLAVVNRITEPKIQELRTEGVNSAMLEVAPAGSIGEEQHNPGGQTVVSYFPISDGGEVGGYVLKLVGAGYAGDMNLIAGYYPTGEIMAVKLMENQETPGLGKEAENSEYMDKYIGTGGELPVPVSKGDLSQEDADGVSGATITFVGIGMALREGSEFVRSIGDDK